MKTIRNSFYKSISFFNFLNAYYKTKLGKSYTKDILSYYVNYEVNLIDLMNNIKSFNYKVGKYKSFVIYEPKKRIIRCLSFEDRIVQTWYVECFLKPYFIPRFIYDSYACIENKGTHKGVKRLKYFMNYMRNKYNNYYVIKFDIKHFFESIDKDILFSILNLYISDKYLLEFSKELIYSYKDKGIPIGNYTSQYFANIYLNELDYYVKHKLKIKCYLRYMDDFIILVKDKYEAKYIYDLVEIFLNNRLKLQLNKKSRYFKNKEGIDFLGYIIYEDYIKVRKRSIKKMNKKIKVWNKLYKEERFNKKKFILSFNAWLGYIKHANSYRLKNKMISKMKFLDKNSNKN